MHTMRHESLACLGIFLILFLMEASQAEIVKRETSGSVNSNLAAKLEDLKNDRAARLIAYHTTKTKAVFATTTSYALSTCFSTLPAGDPCNGRKKRNLFLNKQVLSDDLTEELSGSINEDSKSSFVEDSAAKKERKGKSFTFWNTVFNTYTITQTLYSMGVTVTVSADCVDSNLVQECFG